MIKINLLDTQKCSTCGLVRPISLFYRRDSSGMRKVCKSCVTAHGNKHAETRKAYRKSYQATESFKKKARARHLMANYGICEDVFQLMEILQEGRCKICGLLPTVGRHHILHVDHDHKTGRVRGLLCHSCNVAIGSLGDSFETVINAARYLMENT